MCFKNFFKAVGIPAVHFKFLNMCDYSRKLDKREQSRNNGPGVDITRVENPGYLAMSKTGKTRTSLPG